VTRTAARLALARILPGSALALAATSVSAAALHRFGAVHDARAVAGGAALVVNAALWWGFAFATVFRVAPAERGPLLRGAALVGLASAAAVAIRPTGAADAGWPQVAASGAVSVVSLCLAVAALGWLGRCFGVLPDARGLVTRGPYRLVRHPMYLGELGAIVGIEVAAPSAWNLGALAALAVAQVGRARLEERTLRRAFPAYAAYAARTPMLIPRLRARVPIASAAVSADAR